MSHAAPILMNNKVLVERGGTSHVGFAALVVPDTQKLSHDIAQ
jgi:hypothetical protein